MTVRGLVVLALAGCAGAVSTDADIVVDVEETETEWEADGEGGCPDSWVLTYSIAGRVDITDTPLDIGNADALVGGAAGDEVVIRIADDGGKPAEGQALMTRFSLLQDFSVSVDMIGEIRINSYLLSESEDECGVASGQIGGDTLRWDECVYLGQHGSPSWSPDQGAAGAGCVTDYHVEGTIECVDESWIVSCENGWLDEGVNQQDYTYNQPLLDFQFDSPDLQSFTMIGDLYGTELPTYTNNRTWLILDGTLKSMELQETPECLCAE